MQVLQPTGSFQNVHSVERWISVAGGIALLASSRNQGLFRGGVGLLAGAALIHRALTGRCEVYRVLGLRTAPSTATLPYELGIRARASVTIARPRGEVFEFFRRLENLPRVMRHLISVERLGNNRSHWVAKGPAGVAVAWDAEVINEVEDELIGWKSLPGSDVDHAGSLHFRDASEGQGTEVRVELQYNPPAGVIGAYVARLFGREPEQEMAGDLQRLKEYLEASAVRNVGSPSRSVS